MEKQKLGKILTVVVVAFLVIGLSIFGVKKWQQKSVQPEPVKEAVKETTAAPVTESAAEQKSEEAVVNLPEDKQGLGSENYKIEQIRFGGDTSITVDDSESLPVEIYNVKNEPFSNRKGDESRVVITWRSNKLTSAEIEYAKSSGQNPKTVSEGGFAFSHSVVLSDLEQGSAYLYRIKSKDRWGNANTSEYFGVYTGSKAVSIFEMIGKAFNDIFGWAVNK